MVLEIVGSRVCDIDTTINQEYLLFKSTFVHIQTLQ